MIVYWCICSTKGPIFSVQFSFTGKWLLSASLDGTACVWDVATKQLAMQFKVHTSVYQIALQNRWLLINIYKAGCLDVDWLDESTFVTCSANRTLHLVSLLSYEAIRTFVLVSPLAVICMIFSSLLQWSYKRSKSSQIQQAQDTSCVLLWRSHRPDMGVRFMDKSWRQCSEQEGPQFHERTVSDEVPCEIRAQWSYAFGGRHKMVSRSTWGDRNPVGHVRSFLTICYCCDFWWQLQHSGALLIKLHVYGMQREEPACASSQKTPNHCFLSHSAQKVNLSPLGARMGICIFTMPP